MLGQTLVEFALVVPVFLLIVFSIIQFGFLYAGQSALQNSAREVARYAAVVQTATSVTAPTFQAQAYNDLTSNVLPRSVPGFRSGNLVTSGAGSTAVCYVVNTNPGTPTTYSVFVRVQISYRHPLLFPFPPIDLIDGTLDSALRLGATEEMRVENPLITESPGGLPTCP